MDPGFSRRGEGHSLSLWQKPTIWQDFCRKLHENEINWTGGWHAFLAPPRPPGPSAGSYCRLPESAIVTSGFHGKAEYTKLRKYTSGRQVTDSRVDGSTKNVSRKTRLISHIRLAEGFPYNDVEQRKQFLPNSLVYLLHNVQYM